MNTLTNMRLFLRIEHQCENQIMDGNMQEYNMSIDAGWQSNTGYKRKNRLLDCGYSSMICRVTLKVPLRIGW